jgi:preprotein translocase subunit SecB
MRFSWRANLNEESKMSQQEEGASSNTEQAVDLRLSPFQMLDVRLKEVSAKILESDEIEGGESDVQIRLIEDDGQDSDQGFDLALYFRILEIDEEDASFELSVTLEGHFEAIVEPTTIDEQSVRRFKRVDAITLLWPYLRETVHSMTERMGLNRPPLPIINPRQLAASSSSKGEASSE